MSDSSEYDPTVDWPLLPEQYDDANDAIDFLYNLILESGMAGFATPGVEDALHKLADGGQRDPTEVFGRLAMGMTSVATVLVHMRQIGMGKSPQETVEALRRTFTPPADGE